MDITIQKTFFKKRFTKVMKPSTYVGVPEHFFTFPMADWLWKRVLFEARDSIRMEQHIQEGKLVLNMSSGIARHRRKLDLAIILNGTGICKK